MGNMINPKWSRWLNKNELNLSEKINERYPIPTSFSKKQLKILFNIKDVDIFNKNQYREIIEGIKENIDVSIYAKLEFNSLQMNLIRIGIQEDVDISIYSKPEFNAAQMCVIEIGLESKLNALLYAKKELTEMKMSTVRKLLYIYLERLIE